jgi:hypothetical protein
VYPVVALNMVSLTCRRSNFVILNVPQANLVVYEKGVYHVGLKSCNRLPCDIKNIFNNQKKYKQFQNHFYIQIPFIAWMNTVMLIRSKVDSYSCNEFCIRLSVFSLLFVKCFVPCSYFYIAYLVMQSVFYLI